MIVVVVGIGSTLFALATNSFSSFSSNLSNQFTNSGNQLSEQIVMEQIIFSTSGTQGANIYVRNDGVNPVTIASLYVQNETANSFVESVQIPSSSQVTINSGDFTIITVTFTPDQGNTYGFTIASTLGTTLTSFAKLT